MKKSIHLPISDSLLQNLKEHAKKENRTVSGIVAEAVENWLKQKRKEKIYQQIKEFSSKYAGSKYDLDEELEAAGSKFLLEENK
jgi:predicted transcriptional regulator